MHHESPPDEILRWPQVKAITGISRSTCWRLMPDSFPQSIKLSARAVGWKKSEIYEWVASRSESRPQETFHKKEAV